ncbi:MAG: oxidoreductase [Rhodoglobus sp.]|nr:oxidoreductase [Rhodoglobus sp.]
MSPRRVLLWSALVGVLTGIVTLAIAEAVAAIMVLPSGSPLFGVGSLVIDLVPGWFKTVVIGLFGTGDKVALFVALGILVLLLAVGIGILQYRRPPWGILALVALGIVALLAVVTRAESNALSSVPTLVGVLAGVIVLRLGIDRLHRWTDAAASRPARAAVTRRGFLVMLGATTAGALVIGLGARAINAGTAAVNAVREAIKLPRPATPEGAFPAGASLDVPGISPLLSANDTFYRIDTALQVPVVDASTWKLRVTGMVEREVEITFDELLALPLVEHTVTLMCVSNEVGGNLVGNATWLGYPIRDLLAQAGPLPGADMVLSTSVDGFTAGSPLSVLLEEDRQSLLAVGMNGEPLPLEHGFPARLVVPGLYGYVSATKWVTELKVTTFAKDMGYWTPRGWDALGPVKTASRIDVPQSGAGVSAGRIAVAGVAWAQHRGIEAVEVRVDDGTWMPAVLADAISIDTWRQWVYEWDATSGNHTVAVRATGAVGDTQRDVRLPPAPNGSEGYHTVTVTVG